MLLCTGCYGSLVDATADELDAGVDAGCVKDGGSGPGGPDAGCEDRDH